MKKQKEDTAFSNVEINSKNLTRLIIGLTVFFGLSLVLLGEFVTVPYGWLSSVIKDIGIGLISAGLISYFIDKIWGKMRIEENKRDIQPIIDKMNDVKDKIEMYEGRMEALKKIGLNYCHGNRKETLSRFYDLAEKYIKENSSCIEPDENDYDKKKIKIVASSARGLIGFIDRDVDSKIKYKWRDLIDENSSHFQILLTHPAYAHLRQPAEERPNGAIEVEIIKAALRFLYISELNDDGLRFYRGSPTVFMIQVGNEIMINPYPYGTMAMKTICLEFTGVNDDSFINEFAKSHFDHTWAFYDQDDKIVDSKAFVCGISTIEDIVLSIMDCTFLGRDKDLRLTEAQVKSIDTFIEKQILPAVKENKQKEIHGFYPLVNHLRSQGFYFCYPEYCGNSEETKELLTQSV